MIDEMLNAVIRPRISWIEATALVVPSLALIFVLSRGESNGVGVFHQPEHDLLVPMLTGALLNGIASYLHAFYLIPDLVVSRRLLVYGARLALLATATLVVGTAAHQVLIFTAEPSLRHLSWNDLARENLIALIVFLILSGIYGLARLGILRAQTPPLQEKVAAGADHIEFQSGRKLHRFPANEILYLQGRGNYVKVVSRRRSVLVYTTLREQEARLCAGPEFARIHRSYIVSLRNLETADRAAIKVGGRRLPVSDSYSKAFVDKLGLES